MENKTNGLSIAGFVVSCCSLLVNFYGVVGLVGLILSAVGRSHAKSEGTKTGLATAGIVISLIGMLMGIIVLITALAFISKMNLA